MIYLQPCSAVLEKFRIGEIESVATLARYEQQGDEDKLYEELKHAVNEYFHENKVGCGRSAGLLWTFANASQDPKITQKSAAAGSKVFNFHVHKDSTHLVRSDAERIGDIFYNTVVLGASIFQT